MLRAIYKIIQERLNTIPKTIECDKPVSQKNLEEKNENKAKILMFVGIVPGYS